jgi:hypothetical protein
MEYIVSVATHLAGITPDVESVARVELDQLTLIV